MAGTRTDVPAVLRGLHVFVLPSRAEGISNTILEAMATGLPVLATAVGGNPELVEPGQTGLLVPAGDAQALAAAMWALSPEGVRQAMGRAGRERVERRFSLGAMVRRYRGLYGEALRLK
jgi:glycosyltransferase involved in cell wall biosynthesis